VVVTAGSETTETVLGGISNYLATKSNKCGVSVEDVRSAFESEAEIHMDKVKRSPYFDAVINEGLRLCPLVPGILPRSEPEGGGTLCGTWLPGGVSAMLDCPRVYEQSRLISSCRLGCRFKPERWLPEEVENLNSRFHHDCLEVVQTFSVGPRSYMVKGLAWEKCS